MSIIIDLLNESGHWFRQYQYQAALAIIATVLVLFGHEINSAIKSLIKNQHFIIRSIIFVLVCAFGYGLATVWLTSLLSAQLAKIPNLYILPTVIGVFTALGIYAQKQKHI